MNSPLVRLFLVALYIALGDLNSNFHVLNILYNDKVHLDLAYSIAHVVEMDVHIQCNLIPCMDNCLHVTVEHVAPLVVDRSCLLQFGVPEQITNSLRIEYPLELGVALENIVLFVNKHCNTFLTVDGIVSNGFSNNSHMFNNLFDISSDQTCDVVDAENFSLDDFNSNYWFSQKPVVIKNFQSLPVSVRDLFSAFLHSNEFEEFEWNNDDLSVSVKLNPIIEFEGVDSVLNWEMASTQYIPPKVLNQLISPDLVVVRAVHQEMTLSEALRLMSANRLNNSKLHPTPEVPSVFAYVEYLNAKSEDLLKIVQAATMSVRPHLTPLIGKPTAVDDNRTLHFLNSEPYIWLSNGHTVGKLHYDPFDNVLVQVQGVKSFLLIPPSYGVQMAEGHMREANVELVQEEEGGEEREGVRFRKRLLTESTSMVHTPLYFEHEYPGAGEYRDAADIPRRRSVLYQGLHRSSRRDRSQGADKIPVITSCDVYPGDAIYVPAYYWHEVISYPYPTNHSSLSGLDVNFAINYWHAPLAIKEFPCPTCNRSLNPIYRDLFAAHFN